MSSASTDDVMSMRHCMFHVNMGRPLSLWQLLCMSSHLRNVEHSTASLQIGIELLFLCKGTRKVKAQEQLFAAVLDLVVLPCLAQRHFNKIFSVVIQSSRMLFNKDTLVGNRDDISCH